MNSISSTDLSATDQCVLCGMCSSVCPTYKHRPVEMESPRGRISIIQAYAQQSTPPTPQALQHINHCTGCNLCQSICPSQVPFEQLIDQFKSLHSGKNSLLMSIFLHIATKPHGFNRLKPFINTCKKLGLFKLLRFSSIISNAQQLLECIHDGKQITSPISKPLNDASVALFIGCTEELFDQKTLTDVLQVLADLGIHTVIPEQQFCCGALHQHNGHPKTARQLLHNNARFFSEHNVKQVVFCASGCGRQLQQIDSNIKYTDIMSFIHSHLASNKIKFNALDADVYIHHSCSAHSLHISATTTKLLSQIPQMRLINITNDSCCGAGGSNLLFQAELAKEIIADKIHALDDASPRFLISDNLGCSLHFKKQLARSGIDVEVIHPVSLIARQLS